MWLRDASSQPKPTNHNSSAYHSFQPHNVPSEKRLWVWFQGTFSDLFSHPQKTDIHTQRGRLSCHKAHLFFSVYLSAFLSFLSPTSRDFKHGWLTDWESAFHHSFPVGGIKSNSNGSRENVFFSCTCFFTVNLFIFSSIFSKGRSVWIKNTYFPYVSMHCLCELYSLRISRYAASEKLPIWFLPSLSAWSCAFRRKELEYRADVSYHPSII